MPARGPQASLDRNSSCSCVLAACEYGVLEPWTSCTPITSLRRDVRKPRPSRRARLRCALPLVPLADPGALQYRRRCLRPLGRDRSRAHRHFQPGRRRRGGRGELRRAARSLEPPRQRARRPRHRARGSHRAAPGTGTGGRSEPHRHLQARRHRAAAGDAVRRRRHRLPPRGFRRARADHQCAGACEARRRTRSRLRSRIRVVDRRVGGRRRGLPRDARARRQRLHAGRHHAR